jgi:hypothetical protein
MCARVSSTVTKNATRVAVGLDASHTGSVALGAEGGAAGRCAATNVAGDFERSDGDVQNGARTGDTFGSMPERASISAAEYVPVPPRALTDRELAGFLVVADALIPDGTAGPRPSRAERYPSWLARALAARRDSFERIVQLAAGFAEMAPEAALPELRRLSQLDDSGFSELSSVIAGAYLLEPEVRAAIGYPGQAQRPARFDQAAEEIMGGILDPVIERGSLYAKVEPSGSGTAEAGK